MEKTRKILEFVIAVIQFLFKFKTKDKDKQGSKKE